MKMHRILPLLFLLMKTFNCFTSFTIRNHVYVGTVSERLYGIDWLRCLEACGQSESCVSYNYKLGNNLERTDTLCELFDSADFNDCDLQEGVANLFFAVGFIFHQIGTNFKPPTYQEGSNQNLTIRAFTDCQDALSAGQKLSGVFAINPDGQQEFQVFCDQNTQGGGWIVFQKRYDGSVDFYQNWTTYKVGFGNLKGEFWLGLDKIYLLTSLKRVTLRVDLGDFNGASAYALYDLFRVLDENNSYELRLGNYTGTSGDSLTWHDGLPFSTKDQNSGDCAVSNCAFLYHGAWWYGGSFQSNLNGRYYVMPQGTPSLDSVIWEGWRGFDTSLKRTEMKIRPYI